eukprot:TRINITY_DN7813_c0_g1_i1.p1 TRINITY_DN7813_c0_g1~~TRINITY_DN7813_c0_g1_i1.p1  ORF type:complete len:7612 (+),score=1122.46 TRINITY_DN7813_c0_g1_i1:103-22938(+)
MLGALVVCQLAPFAMQQQPVGEQQPRLHPAVRSESAAAARALIASVLEDSHFVSDCEDQHPCSFVTPPEIDVLLRTDTDAVTQVLRDQSAAAQQDSVLQVSLTEGNRSALMPGVADLVRQLERMWKRPFHADLYVTLDDDTKVPVRRGAPWPVVVLHASGTSHWSLFPPPGGSRNSSWGDRGSAFHTSETNGQPCMAVTAERELGQGEEYSMEVGRMLYIPFGVPHSAVCTSAPCVHVTIGVQREGTQMADLARAVASQALWGNESSAELEELFSAIGTLAHTPENLEWRRVVPIQAADEDTGRLPAAAERELCRRYVGMIRAAGSAFTPAQAELLASTRACAEGISELYNKVGELVERESEQSRREDDRCNRHAHTLSCWDCDHGCDSGCDWFGSSCDGSCDDSCDTCRVNGGWCGWTPCYSYYREWTTSHTTCDFHFIGHCLHTTTHYTHHTSTARAECGPGTQYRKCNCPSPANGGSHCPGSSQVSCQTWPGYCPWSGGSEKYSAAHGYCANGGCTMPQCARGSSRCYKPDPCYNKDCTECRPPGCNSNHATTYSLLRHEKCNCYCTGDHRSAYALSGSTSSNVMDFYWAKPYCWRCKVGYYPCSFCTETKYWDRRARIDQAGSTASSNSDSWCSQTDSSGPDLYNKAGTYTGRHYSVCTSKRYTSSGHNCAQEAVTGNTHWSHATRTGTTEPVISSSSAYIEFNHVIDTQSYVEAVWVKIGSTLHRNCYPSDLLQYPRQKLKVESGLVAGLCGISGIPAGRYDSWQDDGCKRTVAYAYGKSSSHVSADTMEWTVVRDSRAPYVGAYLRSDPDNGWYADYPGCNNNPFCSDRYWNPHNPFQANVHHVDNRLYADSAQEQCSGIWDEDVKYAPAGNSYRMMSETAIGACRDIDTDKSQGIKDSTYCLLELSTPVVSRGQTSITFHVTDKSGLPRVHSLVVKVDGTAPVYGAQSEDGQNHYNLVDGESFRVPGTMPGGSHDLSRSATKSWAPTSRERWRDHKAKSFLLWPLGGPHGTFHHTVEKHPGGSYANCTVGEKCALDRRFLSQERTTPVTGVFNNDGMDFLPIQQVPASNLGVRGWLSDPESGVREAESWPQGAATRTRMNAAGPALRERGQYGPWDAAYEVLGGDHTLKSDLQNYAGIYTSPESWGLRVDETPPDIEGRARLGVVSNQGGRPSLGTERTGIWSSARGESHVSRYADRGGVNAQQPTDVFMPQSANGMNIDFAGAFDEDLSGICGNPPCDAHVAMWQVRPDVRITKPVSPDSTFTFKMANVSLYIDMGRELNVQPCGGSGAPGSCRWVFEDSATRASHRYIRLSSSGGYLNSALGSQASVQGCNKLQDLASCQWVLEPSATREGMWYIRAAASSTSTGSPRYLRTVENPVAGTRVEVGECQKHTTSPTGDTPECQWQIESWYTPLAAAPTASLMSSESRWSAFAYQGCKCATVCDAQNCPLYAGQSYCTRNGSAPCGDGCFSLLDGTKCVALYTEDPGSTLWTTEPPAVTAQPAGFHASPDVYSAPVVPWDDDSGSAALPGSSLPSNIFQVPDGTEIRSVVVGCNFARQCSAVSSPGAIVDDSPPEVIPMRTREGCTELAQIDGAGSPPCVRHVIHWRMRDVHSGIKLNGVSWALGLAHNIGRAMVITGNIHHTSYNCTPPVALQSDCRVHWCECLAEFTWDAQNQPGNAGLETGLTYMVQLNISNGRGLVTHNQWPFIPDTSAAAGGVVRDGPSGVDIDFTANSTFCATWAGFQDAESGIASVTIQWIDGSGRIAVPLTDVTGLTRYCSTAQTPQEGTRYHALVTVENNAGNKVSRQSNGVVYAPTPPVPKDFNVTAKSRVGNTFFPPQGTAVRVTWGAFESHQLVPMLSYELTLKRTGFVHVGTGTCTGAGGSVLASCSKDAASAVECFETCGAKSKCEGVAVRGSTCTIYLDSGAPEGFACSAGGTGEVAGVNSSHSGDCFAKGPRPGGVVSPYSLQVGTACPSAGSLSVSSLADSCAVKCPNGSVAAPKQGDEITYRLSPHGEWLPGLVAAVHANGNLDLRDNASGDVLSYWPPHMVRSGGVEMTCAGAVGDVTDAVCGTEDQCRALCDAEAECTAVVMSNATTKCYMKGIDCALAINFTNGWNYLEKEKPEVKVSGTQHTGLLPAPKFQGEHYFVKLVGRTAAGIPAEATAELRIDMTPPICCRGALWEQSRSPGLARPIVSPASGGRWLRNRTSACLRVLGLFDEETGVTARVDVLDAQGRQAGSARFESGAGDEEGLSGCVQTTPAPEGTRFFVRVVPQNTVGLTYAPFAGPRNTAGDIVPLVLETSRPSAHPPALSRGGSLIEPVQQSSAGLQARAVCIDDGSGVASMRLTLRPAPSAATAATLLSQQDGGAPAYSANAGKNCNGSDIDTEWLADRCYRKCGNWRRHTPPVMTGRCDGNLVGYGPDSVALCVNATECQALCDADPTCYAVAAHTTLNRCFLKSAHCVHGEIVDDNDYDLLFKPQRYTKTTGQRCTAEAIDLVNSPDVELPSGYSSETRAVANAGEADCKAMCDAIPACRGVSLQTAPATCTVHELGCTGDALVSAAAHVFLAKNSQYASFTGKGCTGYMLPTATLAYQCRVRCGGSTTGVCDGNNITYGDESKFLCASSAECRATCSADPTCYGVAVHTTVQRCYLVSVGCASQTAWDNAPDWRLEIKPESDSMGTLINRTLYGAIPMNESGKAWYLPPSLLPAAVANETIAFTPPLGEPFLLGTECANGAGLRSSSFGGPFLVTGRPQVDAPLVYDASTGTTGPYFRGGVHLDAVATVRHFAVDIPEVHIYWARNSTPSAAPAWEHTGPPGSAVALPTDAMPRCEWLVVVAEARAVVANATAVSQPFILLTQPAVSATLSNSSSTWFNVSWSTDACAGLTQVTANLRASLLAAPESPAGTLLGTATDSAPGSSGVIAVNVTRARLREGDLIAAALNVTDPSGQQASTLSPPKVFDVSPPAGHLWWDNVRAATSTAANLPAKYAVRDPHSGVAELTPRARCLGCGVGGVVWEGAPVAWPAAEGSTLISLGGSPSPGERYVAEVVTKNGAGLIGILQSHPVIFSSNPPTFNSVPTVGPVAGVHATFARSTTLHFSVDAADADTGTFTATVALLNAAGGVVKAAAAVELTPAGTLWEGQLEAPSPPDYEHNGRYKIRVTLANAAGLDASSDSAEFTARLLAAGDGAGNQVAVDSCVTNVSSTLVCPCATLSAQWDFQEAQWQPVDGRFRVSVRSADTTTSGAVVTDTTVPYSVSGMQWNTLNLTDGNPAPDHPPVGVWQLCVAPAVADYAAKEICSASMTCVNTLPSAGTLVLPPVWRCDTLLRFKWKGVSTHGAPLLLQEWRLDGGSWTTFAGDGEAHPVSTLTNKTYTLQGRVTTMVGQSLTETTFAADLAPCSVIAVHPELPLRTGGQGQRYYTRSTKSFGVRVDGPPHAACRVMLSATADAVGSDWLTVPCNETTSVTVPAQVDLTTSTGGYVLAQCASRGSEECTVPAAYAYGGTARAQATVIADRIAPTLGAFTVPSIAQNQSDGQCDAVFFSAAKGSQIRGALGWPGGCPNRNADLCEPASALYTGVDCTTRYTTIGVRVTATDTASGVAWVSVSAGGHTYNNTSPSTQQVGFDVPLLAEGPTRIDACAADFAGNEVCASHASNHAQVKPITVISDTTPPRAVSVVLLHDCANWITVDWSGGADASAVKWVVAAGTNIGDHDWRYWTVESAPPPLNLTGLTTHRSNGPGFVTVVAEDAAGNVAAGSVAVPQRTPGVTGSPQAATAPPTGHPSTTATGAPVGVVSGGGHESYTVYPGLLCTVGTLNTSAEAEQCHSKCGSNTTKPGCNGTSARFLSSSNALCATEAACRALCDARADCYAVSRHTSLDRCWLLGRECATADLAESGSHQLEVRGDVFGARLLPSDTTCVDYGCSVVPTRTECEDIALGVLAHSQTATVLTPAPPSPTASPVPPTAPPTSAQPSASPSAHPAPPTASPTMSPLTPPDTAPPRAPSKAPAASTTTEPTAGPSQLPTAPPTLAPTAPTVSPTITPDPNPPGCSWHTASQTLQWNANMASTASLAGVRPICRCSLPSAPAGKHYISLGNSTAFLKVGGGGPRLGPCFNASNAISTCLWSLEPLSGQWRLRGEHSNSSAAYLTHSMELSACSSSSDPTCLWDLEESAVIHRGNVWKIRGSGQYLNGAETGAVPAMGTCAGNGDIATCLWAVSGWDVPSPTASPFTSSPSWSPAANAYPHCAQQAPLPPKAVVVDGLGPADLAFLTDGATVSCAWSVTGATLAYTAEWGVGTHPGTDDAVPLRDANGASSVSSPLQLVHGTMYYCAVRIVAGGTSHVFHSNGAIADLTPLNPQASIGDRWQASRDVVGTYDCGQGAAHVVSAVAYFGTTCPVGAYAGGPVANGSCPTPGVQGTGEWTAVGGTRGVWRHTANADGAVCFSICCEAATGQAAVAVAPEIVIDTEPPTVENLTVVGLYTTDALPLGSADGPLASLPVSPAAGSFGLRWRGVDAAAPVESCSVHFGVAPFPRLSISPSAPLPSTPSAAAPTVSPTGEAAHVVFTTDADVELTYAGSCDSAELAAVAARGAGSALPLGGAPYTIELFVRTTDSASAEAPLVSWGGAGTGKATGISIVHGGSAVRSFWTWSTGGLIGVYGHSDQAGYQGLADGKWHHVATTYDGTTRRVFVDYVEVANDTRSPSAHHTNATADFQVGCGPGAANFSGTLRDVRVLSGAQAPAAPASFTYAPSSVAPPPSTTTSAPTVAISEWFSFNGTSLALDPIQFDTIIPIDVVCTNAAGRVSDPKRTNVAVHTKAPAAGAVHHAREVGVPSRGAPAVVPVWWSGLDDSGVDVTYRLIGTLPNGTRAIDIPGLNSTQQPVSVPVPGTPIDVNVTVQGCNSVGRCTVAVSPWLLSVTNAGAPAAGQWAPSDHCTAGAQPTCVFASIGAVRLRWSGFAPDLATERYEVTFGSATVQIAHTPGGGLHVFRLQASDFVTIQGPYPVSVVGIDHVGVRTPSLNAVVQIDAAPPSGGSTTGSATELGNGSVAVRCSWVLPSSAGGLREALLWGVVDAAGAVGSAGPMRSAPTALLSAAASVSGPPEADWHCAVVFHSRAGLAHKLLSADTIWSPTPPDIEVFDGPDEGRDAAFSSASSGVSFSWHTLGHPDDPTSGEFTVVRFEPGVRCGTALSAAALAEQCAARCGQLQSGDCDGNPADSLDTAAVCATPSRCRALCDANNNCDGVDLHLNMNLCYLKTACSGRTQSADWRYVPKVVPTPASTPLPTQQYARAGKVTGHVISGGSIDGEHLYVELQLCWGVRCGEGASDGFLIDQTPPSAGAVEVAGTDGKFVADCPQQPQRCIASIGGRFVVAWSGFSDGAGSGIARYEVKVKSASQAIMHGPVDAGLDTQAEFHAPGIFTQTSDMYSTIVAEVTAYDRAGRSITAESGQVLVEASVPFVPADASAKVIVSQAGEVALTWGRSSGQDVFAATDRVSGVRPQSCIVRATGGSPTQQCPCRDRDWSWVNAVWGSDGRATAISHVAAHDGMFVNDCTWSTDGGTLKTAVTNATSGGPAKCAELCAEAHNCVRAQLTDQGCWLYDKGATATTTRDGADTVCWVAADACLRTASAGCARGQVSGLRAGDYILGCVRAVSGVGLVSAPIAAPPVLYDDTPPIVDGIHVPEWTQVGEATFFFDGARDPDTGIDRCEFAAHFVGSGEKANNVKGFISSVAGKYTVNVPGNVTVTLEGKHAGFPMVGTLLCYNNAGGSASVTSRSTTWDDYSPSFNQLEQPGKAFRCDGSPLTVTWPLCVAASGVDRYEVALDVATPEEPPGNWTGTTKSPTGAPTERDSWERISPRQQGRWTRVVDYVHAGRSTSHTFALTSALNTGRTYRYVVRCWNLAGNNREWLSNSFRLSQALPEVPDEVADGRARDAPDRPELGYFFADCACRGCQDTEEHGFISRGSDLVRRRPGADRRCAMRCIETPGCVRVSLDSSGCALFSKGARLLDDGSSARTCWVAAKQCASAPTANCLAGRAYDIDAQIDTSVVRAHWARPFGNVLTLDACVGRTAADCSAQDWTAQLPTQTEIALYGLQLQDQYRYVTRLRACSRCGHCVVVTTDGFAVDSRRPLVPVVWPGPTTSGAKPERIEPTTTAVMHWPGSPNSAECLWAIGESAGSISVMDWSIITCAGGQESMNGVPLGEGLVFYHSVRVCNRLQLCATGSSRPVRASAHPAVVQDVAVSQLGHDVDVIEPGAVWGAKWFGFDLVHTAKIERFEWAIDSHGTPTLSVTLPSATDTRSVTQTMTLPTTTGTATLPTVTATVTGTFTLPSETDSVTSTITLPTRSLTLTATFTGTPTATDSLTATATTTATLTLPEGTASVTQTVTLPAATNTATETLTETRTFTDTETFTLPSTTRTLTLTKSIPLTNAPTSSPTTSPSTSPTPSPSGSPTSSAPSVSPSGSPSGVPTVPPSQPPQDPTVPPSASPLGPSVPPSAGPSAGPSEPPTSASLLSATSRRLLQTPAPLEPCHRSKHGVICQAWEDRWSIVCPINGSSYTVYTDYVSQMPHTCPMETGQTYRVLVRAIYADSVSHVAFSNGVTVTNEAPVSQGVHMPALVTSFVGLTVHWHHFRTAVAPVVLYRLLLKTSTGEPIIDERGSPATSEGWMDMGMDNFYTFVLPQIIDVHNTNVTLPDSDGKDITATVQACNAAGICATGQSLGVPVLLSAPDPPHVWDGHAADKYTKDREQSTTESNNTIKFAFQPCVQSAKPSLRLRHEWCVGTVPGTCDVVTEWQSITVYHVGDPVKEVTASGLTLVRDQAYFATVRCSNDGNLTVWSASNGVFVVTHELVDDEACGQVFHGLQNRRPKRYQSETDRFSAHWIDQHLAFGAGAAIYDFSVELRDSDSVPQLLRTSVGYQQHVQWTNLTLRHGVAYSAYVYVFSSRGRCLRSADVPTLIDTTPPTAANISAPDLVKSAQDVSLTVVRPGADPESGIAAMEVAVGTTPYGTQVLPYRAANVHDTTVPLTGAVLRSGARYYATVIVRNGAGLTAASQASFRTDWEPPAIKVSARAVTYDGGEGILAVWSTTDDSGGAVSVIVSLLSNDATMAAEVEAASGSRVFPLPNLARDFLVKVEAADEAGNRGVKVSQTMIRSDPPNCADISIASGGVLREVAADGSVHLPPTATRASLLWGAAVTAGAAGVARVNITTTANSTGASTGVLLQDDELCSDPWLLRTPKEKEVLLTLTGQSRVGAWCPSAVNRTLVWDGEVKVKDLALHTELACASSPAARPGGKFKVSWTLQNVSAVETLRVLIGRVEGEGTVAKEWPAPNRTVWLHELEVPPEFGDGATAWVSVVAVAFSRLEYHQSIKVPIDALQPEVSGFQLSAPRVVTADFGASNATFAVRWGGAVDYGTNVCGARLAIAPPGGCRAALADANVSWPAEISAHEAAVALTAAAGHWEVCVQVVDDAGNAAPPASALVDVRNASLPSPPVHYMACRDGLLWLRMRRPGFDPAIPLPYELNVRLDGVMMAAKLVDPYYTQVKLQLPTPGGVLLTSSSLLQVSMAPRSPTSTDIPWLDIIPGVRFAANLTDFEATACVGETFDGSS